MGARIVSRGLTIFALSIFIFILILAVAPQVFAYSVSLSVDNQYPLADGYSTSQITATAAGAGPGQIVNFSIDDSSGESLVTATTNSAGMASITIGPYPYGDSENVTVSAYCNGIPSSTNIYFLAKSNLKIYSISPGTTNTVGTTVMINARWDITPGIPVANVPLTFTAYDPYFNMINGSPDTVTTNGSGVAVFTFTMSNISGYNWVSLSLNGETVKSVFVAGTGGNIDHFDLYTTPVSPIFADGQTNYVLYIKALDVFNNTVPGKSVDIQKDGVDIGTYPTNSNGVIDINLGASSFVQDVNITATSVDTLAADSINLSYIKGIASNISVIANPPAVANANVSSVTGQADVHLTDVTATLTDYWGHPISGETVYLTSLNSSLGTMWNVTSNTSVGVTASGVTDASGEFSFGFRLADDVNFTDISIGAPILASYSNATTDVNTSDVCYVLYTDQPFVVATTRYTPSSNLSVNETINVTVSLKACGWINQTNYNNSAILVFDTSGSMNWMSNTIYPNASMDLPNDTITGTLNPASNTVDYGWYGVDPSDWQFITNYTYSGNGSQDLDIILSSDYRAYSSDNEGSFYYLKVIDPSGVNVYHTDNGGNSIGNGVANNYQNENLVGFSNAVSGTYQIYGAYIQNSSMGDVPYNLMVLTDPKRLGQSTDLDSAAKVAGTTFVSLMNKNQVGVVWFNDSYPLAPIASFTANRTAGNAPFTVQFTDTSINSPSTWSWNFGDGSTDNSNNPNPVHTYTSAGTYNVKLTVSNTGGTNSVTYYSYITVHHKIPTPSFTANQTANYAPMTVAFTDTTGDGSVTGWLWNFGDGGSSTSQNPIHTYASTGTYTVSLTETNDGGTNTTTKANYITVNPHSALPVVNFVAMPTSTTANVSISFTDLTTGNNLQSWLWNFGDGQTSTQRNPIHAYKNAATYTVTLTVTNDGGSNSMTRTNYITVTNNNPPVADFVGNPTTINAGQSVSFTDESTGTAIYLWQWNFGDLSPNATVASSASQVHQYTVPGTYTVTLTVTNDGGPSTMQKVGYITVNVVPTATPSATPTATATPIPQPPVANFVGSPTSGYNPLTVSFTDESSNSPTSWYWTFGDGGWSTLKNPSYTYLLPGVYNVTLTSTNSVGSSDPLTKYNYITVYAHNATPVANFTSSLQTGPVPLTVQFFDTSAGNNITSWSWNFGDGNTSTAKNPIYTYYSVGNWTVTHTVTNDGGSNTLTVPNYIIITHNPPPVANFTMNPTGGDVPLSVQFTDTSAGNDLNSWLWNFGDGNISNARNPVHTFSSVGTSTVTLTVTNDDGSNSTSRVVVVSHNSLPQAAFNSNVTSGNIPLCVQFYDNSTGGNIGSWEWNFGDGSNNSTLQNPVHTYQGQGLYTVTLTVTNDAGSSTKQIKNYITAINPGPTSTPMLAGILANLLKTFSVDASASGVTPMSPPAGLAMGLTTIDGNTSVIVDNAINGLSSYGGTNISAGIIQAISEFNSGNFTPGNRRYILLLTDGYSQHPELDIAAAEEAASQNITIYTVGIGMPDTDTLYQIATITNGSYRRVTSMPDLVNVFSAIANNITDVAGYNISMCTFTNYSNLTTPLIPDTTYVPNSTMITRPGVDGLMENVDIEPIIYEDDVGQIYSLTWPSLGNLSYNQNMTVNYQLKVMNSGNITPITNNSYVGFWTKNGTFQKSNFSGPVLYVNGTGNDIKLASPDLTVNILTPSNNTTFTGQRIVINWYTEYTGSDTYNQTVDYSDPIPLLPLPPNGYGNSVSGTYQYVWDITNIPNGNYVLKVSAYDSYCSDSSSVNVTVYHPPGSIQLE